MKKRFQPNISWLIFLLILFYLGFLCWGYFTKEHISIYEVNTTEISDDQPLYGFILRSEEVFKTDTEGYINYYNAEGSRVGPGDVIYTVDSNGEVSSMLEELQSSEQNSASISSIREVIASYHTSFSLSNYNLVSSLKFDINNVIFEQNNGSLYSDLNKALKAAGKSKDFTKVTSTASGVITYSIDGYEDIRQDDLTSEIVSQYNKVTRQQIQTKEKFKAGDPVYKLVSSNEWNLIVPLDDDYYEAMSGLSSIRVTVEKDNISFNSPVELFEQDGIHFVKLTTSRYMERYINDRFLRIEFNIKSASGLKIPNSSILSKDHYVLPADVITKGDSGNGVIKQVTDELGNVSKQFVSLGNYFVIQDEYYVDSSVVSGGDILLNNTDGSDYIVSSMEPLYGVYCVNEGYCEFRPIDIIYQNSDYTIVSDSTTSGLSAFDHIVVDPSNLNDDDFIE
jgi:hypothetical protein